MPIRSALLLAGMLLAIWMPGDLHAAASWGLAIVVALALCTARMRALLFAGLGFFLASHAALKVLAQEVACDERVLVAAHVVSIPQRQGSGWQFDAQLHFPRQPGRAEVRARVTSNDSPTRRPQAGEEWMLALQLRGAEHAAGDATRRVLLRDGIGVEARLLRSTLNQPMEPARHSMVALRQHVADRIYQRVMDPAAAALLAALAVGATGEVSSQQWRVFNATGITHLVAISGMHVTFFAMLSMAMARRLWGLIPGVCARVRRETFAGAFGITLAAAYALLSGFSVPAQRTLVMLVAFLCARECARANAALWSVAVALVVVLLYDPLAVLSAGFWLSFAAVASIILVSGAQLGASGVMRAAISVQLVVSVALVPVTLLIFGTFSLAGLLVNALAIPAFTFLLVPPVLLATLGYLMPGVVSHWLADRLLDVAARVAQTGWPWLASVADQALALLHAAPAGCWYLAAVPAVALVVMPWGGWLRTLGAAVLLSAVLMRPPAPRPGQLWVNMLDVGAANSVVVSTTNHRLVFGTGESFGTRGRRFEARIARSLMVQSGRGGLDVLYIDSTSADQMRAVLAADALLDTDIVVRDPGRTGPPEIAGCAMRSWNWDAVDFQLQPAPSGKTCVLVIGASGGKMILATEFIGSAPADLVLLPRNAAAASEWSIRQVLRKGGFAIASIDRRQWQAGRWRELRRILAAAGINLLATAEHGTMRFEIGNRQTGTGISPGIRSRTGFLVLPGIWSRQTRVNSCGIGL